MWMGGGGEYVLEEFAEGVPCGRGEGDEGVESCLGERLES